MPTRDAEDPYFVDAHVADPWEGMTDPDGNLIEPPDDDTQTSVTTAERQAVDAGGFWTARPVLEHLHTFARARRVGPWAVLGAALARVICQVSQDVQLPPVIGSYASLNLFIGLVGESGDGKDAAQGVAADALYIENQLFRVNPLGSGEGLAHMFMRPGRKTQDDPHPEPVQYNTRALVTIGEIDSLAAQMQRQSATVAPQLRQAAMGQPLGFFYADVTRRMIVPEHEYRLCLVAGIQPERSGVLLNDSAGGTPQRFVWLPAGDSHAQRNAPEEPTPWVWQPPDFAAAPRAHGQQHPRFLVEIPEEVKEIVIEARVQKLRGEGEKLDSHALLTREKIATALAILDGRIAVNMADWHLSGIIMAVSDAQRARCQRALMAVKERANTAKAIEDADRSLVVEERIDRTKVTKCAEAARRLLLQHGALTGSELRRKLKSTHREYLDPALDTLVLSGEVSGSKVEYQGQKGFRYEIIRG